MESLRETTKRSSEYDEAIDKIGENFEAIDALITRRLELLKVVVEGTEENIIKQLETVRQAYIKKASVKETSLITLRNYSRDIFATQKHVFDKVKPQSVSASIKTFVYCGLSTISLPSFEFSDKPPLIRTNIPTLEFDPKNEKLYQRAVYVGFAHITRNISTIIDPITSVCNPGGGEYELSNPAGAAVNPVSGDILVADNNNGRIVVLSKDLENFKSFGRDGRENACFQDVSGVAVSFDGEVIAVADRGNSRVQIFDKEYNFVRSIVCPHPDEGRACSPFGICFDEYDNIYAAVSHAGVAKFSKSGELLMSFGGPASDCQIKNPHGIMVNDDGEVYVLSRPGEKVHVFTTDGTFLRDISIEKTKDNWNFLTRCGGKNFAISDCSGNCIVFYDRDGNKLHSISQVLPSGIAFGVDGSFYVVNCQDCKVYKF